MPERAVFERSHGELSLDVSVGVHILLVVEQSSLESQSRGCAKTPALTVICQSVQIVGNMTDRPGGSVGNLETF